MGQYQCIGIRTKLTVERKKLKLPFMEPQEVQSELERQLVPPHLYDKLENEDQVIYRLRNSSVNEEFIPFVREFYRIRYEEIGTPIEGIESYFEELSKYHTLKEWIDFIEQNPMECFHLTKNYDALMIKDWRTLDYFEESITLSLDGKIRMECYGGLFKFLIDTIKLRFPQFKMKDTLSMFITG